MENWKLICVFMNRDTSSEDMVLRVLYCGIDHTDLHQIRGELISNTKYPMIPGYATYD